MADPQLRLMLVLVALLLVLWTFASGWLFLIHLIKGEFALAFLVLASGMLTLGLAAFAVARARAGRVG